MTFYACSPKIIVPPISSIPMQCKGFFFFFMDSSEYCRGSIIYMTCLWPIGHGCHRMVCMHSEYPPSPGSTLFTEITCEIPWNNDLSFFFFQVVHLKQKTANVMQEMENEKQELENEKQRIEIEANSTDYKSTIIRERKRKN